MKAIKKNAGGALLAKIDGVELRLTFINRLFCVWKDRVAFPSLAGGNIVRFDDKAFIMVSDKAKDKIRDVLRKQRQIRMTHWRKDHYSEEELTYS